MKVMTLRYPDELDNEIKFINEVNSYNKSKSLMFVQAVHIASAYIKKVKKLKAVTNSYEIKAKIEGDLKIELPWHNDLQRGSSDHLL